MDERGGRVTQRGDKGNGQTRRGMSLWMWQSACTAARSLDAIHGSSSPAVDGVMIAGSPRLDLRSRSRVASLRAGASRLLGLPWPQSFDGRGGHDGGSSHDGCFRRGSSVRGSHDVLQRPGRLQRGRPGGAPRSFGADPSRCRAWWRPYEACGKSRSRRLCRVRSRSASRWAR